jgi:carotenoid cleavage dioxygenase
VERTVSNTSPVVHAGVLLALKEDGRPYAMDPVTLENRGPWNFHGTFKGKTFTAHPRLDPRTGEMFAFGFSNDDLFSPDVIYYEIDGRGRVRHEVKFELPYHCMQHDFGLTRDYVIWPIVPLCGGGVERLKQRLPFYGWDPTKPIYLCVLPRGGRVDDIRWFTGPTQFAAHVMNAFNEGTVVHLDVCRSDGNGFPFFPEYGKAFDFDKSLTRLARWTVEYAEGGRSPQTAAAIRSTRQLSDFIGDFPRIDHRFQGSAYRHGWMLKWTGSRNALAHVDLKSGTTDVFETPADTPPAGAVLHSPQSRGRRRRRVHHSGCNANQQKSHGSASVGRHSGFARPDSHFEAADPATLRLARVLG